MSGLRTNPKREIASFDEDAWQDAVEKSGIEVVEPEEVADVSENVTETVTETVPEQEIADASETDVVETSETEVTPIADETEPTNSVDEAEIAEVSKKEEPFSMKKPCKGEVLQACSLEELMYYEGTNDWRTHNGIDFAADIGDPVYASADGVVSHIYEDDLLGLVLLLDHQNGITSLYGNIQSPDFIKAGTAVLKGDVVGGVGKAGILEADAPPHLHFEVLCDDENRDPMEFIDAK